ncbi:hypothetical protein DFH08DRAFT_808356 [Mycena albidolilacea]|uniref:Myb/SANT-like domain-containing protein n=1 Tax=Mycena albidolilacea TaxID=1033008 RepID=A0AAD7ET92_9AGAR|nr:hypothetical protein DFH08DRAFT_808356 [Mycena albidolilacea]
MPPNSAEDTTPKAHWIEDETIALIDSLIAKKSMHQSGNGWKPSVWAGVVVLVTAANPEASPKKDQTKCNSKINYLKETFEMYLFVKKYSGIGWDDEDHHATAMEEVIKPFLKVYLHSHVRLASFLSTHGSCAAHHLSAAAAGASPQLHPWLPTLYHLLIPVTLRRRTVASMLDASRHPVPTTQN